LIETTRQSYYAESALKLQAWIRAILSRQHFLTMKRGMTLFQGEVRRWITRAAFVKKVRIAMYVQCAVRRCLAVKDRLRRRKNHAATVIQTSWRGMKPRQQFRTVLKACVRMQCFRRMIMAKKLLTAKKKEREEHNAIETRMTIIQQTFDDATTVQGTVFSVDEGLLDEVETMFEFLRKEIVVLRKRNTKLKKELVEAESDKREIFNHASSVDHAFALSKIRNEQMSKTNLSLLDDNNKRRKEATKLKHELRTQQQAHEAQLQEMRAEFEVALMHREMEVGNSQRNLLSSAALHKREVQMVRDEAGRKQEEHYAQISRLREEIKTTQNSHQDYLSKLMDVLDTTKESRTAVPGSSTDIILRKKDDKIAGLGEEIARLRQMSGAEGNADVASKKEAIKSMKYIVKKNRENRKSRVHFMSALTTKLGESLASGDLSNMQQLLASMKEATLAGEKANSKMDRETVNMIDNTANYAPNGAANGDADLRAENKKLRHKLEKRQTCKRCDYKRRGGKSLGEAESIIEGVSKN